MVKEKTDLRVSLDKALAVRIRDAAARLNVPVSALIRCQMQGFIEAEERSAAMDTPNFRILAEFSLGIRSAVSAMRALSLYSYQDLLNLLTIARLPQPALPEAQIEQMVAVLQSLSETRGGRD